MHSILVEYYLITEISLQFEASVRTYQRFHLFKHSTNKLRTILSITDLTERVAALILS